MTSLSGKKEGWKSERKNHQQQLQSQESRLRCGCVHTWHNRTKPSKGTHTTNFNYLTSSSLISWHAREVNYILTTHNINIVIWNIVIQNNLSFNYLWLYSLSTTFSPYIQLSFAALNYKWFSITEKNMKGIERFHIRI